jgi:hypothetical protein
MTIYGSKSQMNFSKTSDGAKEQSLTGQSSETASESQKSRTSFLNSPEWIEACEAFREASNEYYGKVEDWWAELSDEDQQKAFYCVVKRIYKGDVEERHSYRGVLYDTFGWGPEAYGLGMECNYMEVHNLLYDALDGDTKHTQRELDKINQELDNAAEYDRSQGELD